MDERGLEANLIAIKSETELPDLVTRIIAGDGSAEEEVVSRYKEGILFIINQVVKDQWLAEDLSQETFIIVLKKIRHGDVREPERLSGFIRAVAKNHAIDYVRKARYLANQEKVGGAECIQDSTPSQLDRLLQSERDMAIRKVVAELKSERDRQVLLRLYILEESKDRICADLGLTRGQFDKVVYRAKARYKKLYIKQKGRPGEGQ